MSERIRRKAAAACLVLVALAAGCAGLRGLWPKDPRAQLALATDAYAIALRTAVDLHEAGYLDLKDMQKIAVSARVARSALDAWRLALRQDRDPEAARRRFNRALGRIQSVIDSAEAEDDGHSGGNADPPGA